MANIAVALGNGYEDSEFSIPHEHFSAAGVIQWRSTGHREQAKTEFARQIGQRLASAYRAGEFGKLVLVSEPGFLGHLRRHLNNGLQQAIVHQIDKDLTLLPVDKLRAQLPDKLASAIAD